VRDRETKIELPEEFPEGLPVPEDDGAADHLPGKQLPSVVLESTARSVVDLSALPGVSVAYCFPLMGRPDSEMPQGWDEIPGARGCTPQSCAFCDHYADLRSLGARVFGISAQDCAFQKEIAERLRLPFELLSDEGLILAEALELPLLEADGLRLLRRLTLIIEDGRIQKAFYPVFPPDKNAEEVVQWLSAPDQTGRNRELTAEIHQR
jgi:peroxiredoxin